MTHETVTTLMADAILKAAHPDVHVLLQASKALVPKSGIRTPPGAKRKLTPDQALAAMIEVTRIMREHKLKPAEVWTEAGFTNPTGFYEYTLTHEEMDEDGNVAIAIPTGRRRKQGLPAYVSLVKATARLSGGDETEMLQRLADTIPEFLAPYAAVDTDFFEELTRDLRSLGPYFSRVREGDDGHPIDLREYFDMASRGRLHFDPATKTISGEYGRWTPDYGFSLKPKAPLFARLVARGTATKKVRRKDDAGGPEIVQFEEVEVVYLALTPDRGGIKVVVYAEPWTVIRDMPREVEEDADGEVATSDDTPPDVSAAGKGSVFAGIVETAADPDTYITMPKDVRFTCPAFEAFYDEVEGEALSAEEEHGEGSDPAYDVRQQFDHARRRDLDPDLLRLWSEGRSNEYRWYWDLRFRRLGEAVDRLIPFAIPDHVEVAGNASFRVPDRLARTLYGDENALVSWLTKDATARVRAMEDYQAESADQELAQKLRFRRLMRS